MKKIIDKNGVVRFKGNRIVRYCLENETDLNKLCLLAQQGYFTRSEMREFYKLIGYSISGYKEIDFKLI